MAVNWQTNGTISTDTTWGTSGTMSTDTTWGISGKISTDTTWVLGITTVGASPQKDYWNSAALNWEDIATDINWEDYSF